MSRKPGDVSKNGFNDVIGIALLALALLLLVSQLSFDRYDLAFYRTPHNEPLHNWGYKIGAYLAWFTFLPLGVSAYLLPWILAAFGVANSIRPSPSMRMMPSPTRGSPGPATPSSRKGNVESDTITHRRSKIER